jgi:intracellular multiplication protein IcmO
MIPREVQGPDRGVERSGAQIHREIQPLTQQLGDMLRSSFVGFLIAGLGGVSIFFPVIIDLALPVSLILAAISLLSPVVLPLRLPKFANVKDRNSPSPEDRRAKPAAGVIFIGHHYKTGQQIWITNEDARQHVVVPGTTGAGKTRALLSLMVNALIHGSGFIFVDGKADNGLYADVLAMARRFGREDDVLVLNFLVASGDKATNNFNPFSFCNADSLRELLVSQFESSPGGGDDSNGVFRDGAIALLGSLAPVLVWVRDNKAIPIDIEKIRFATELRSIATLVVKKKFLVRDQNNGEPSPIDVSEMPEEYFYPLRAYLGETGDFDFDLDWNKQKTNEPSRQHSFVLLHFRQTFTQLAVSLGHIFKCEIGDIDMRDVVLNRRILVVNLPTLENSGETTAALGKIVIASLRNMMAQTLGASLEGDYQEIVANKPSMSPTPFPVVLDEVGYYAGPGMDKMLAMGRGLGFSFYLGFQEVAGLRARLGDAVFSLLGNANLQILMRLQEGGQTRDYVENTAGDTFVTQTGSFNQIGGGYRESQSADLRQTTRVNWNDLRGLIEGEAIVLFGKHRVYTKLFYVDPKASGALRLNRPMTLLMPDRARLIAETARLDSTHPASTAG